MNRNYKLKKCPHDHRDYIYQPKIPLKASTKKIDLSSKMPNVLDQFDISSCSSNAVSNVIRYLLVMEKKTVIQPSRLYLYYVSRVFIEKQSPSEDNGVCIRSVCKAVQKYFICDEKIYPYITKFFSEAPTMEVLRSATLYKKIVYSIVPYNLITLKNTLQDHYPIIAGISVYSSFITDQCKNTGIIPMPNMNVESLLGFHTVLIIGFDDDTRMFKIMLSWGDQWGDDGCIYLPYNYVMNPFLAFDFWVITFF